MSFNLSFDFHSFYFGLHYCERSVINGRSWKNYPTSPSFIKKYLSLFESGFFVFGCLIFKDEKKIQSETGTQRQGYFKDNFNKPQILPKGPISMATPTPRTLPLLHK
jgi:hypothetical protein